MDVLLTSCRKKSLTLEINNEIHLDLHETWVRSSCCASKVDSSAVYVGVRKYRCSDLNEDGTLIKYNKLLLTTKYCCTPRYSVLYSGSIVFIYMMITRQGLLAFILLFLQERNTLHDINDATTINLDFSSILEERRTMYYSSRHHNSPNVKKAGRTAWAGRWHCFQQGYKQ